MNTYKPVTVAVKGPRLADGTFSFISSICTVELVVAALMNRVTDRPVLRAACFLKSSHPTEEVPSLTAPASFLIQARFRTVPVSITTLLWVVTASQWSPTKLLPRKAVIWDAIGRIKATPFKWRLHAVYQGKQAGVGFNLYCFAIGHGGDL